MTWSIMTADHRLVRASRRGVEYVRSRDHSTWQREGSANAALERIRASCPSTEETLLQSAKVLETDSALKLAAAADQREQQIHSLATQLTSDLRSAISTLRIVSASRQETRINGQLITVEAAKAQVEDMSKRLVDAYAENEDLRAWLQKYEPTTARSLEQNARGRHETR